MKGFPNQISDLGKLALGISALVSLIEEGANGKDDGIFGQALVRSGVAGTGHRPMDQEEYIRQQLTRTLDNQSFRTTARGLREFYRLMGFVDDSGQNIDITELGKRAAAYSGTPINDEQISFWRGVIRDITQNGEEETSHPYQVLLRLVGQRPGITRAKCALALEARNDSPEELVRITELADLGEDEIINRIGVTQSNWDNAKKILPSLAEQLGDVIVTQVGRDKTYHLADAPGRADMGPALAPAIQVHGRVSVAPRTPRTSRHVVPQTIGRAGTLNNFDEESTAPRPIDPTALAKTIRQRQDRLRRHNLIVQELATLLSVAGTQLYEDPFDILALIARVGILVEVKTLDGSTIDERERVREALGQLLYYEPFAAAPLAGQAIIQKIACFEGPVSDAHRRWLNESGIGVIWKVADGFSGDDLATNVLMTYIQLQ